MKFLSVNEAAAAPAFELNQEYEMTLQANPSKAGNGDKNIDNFHDVH